MPRKEKMTKQKEHRSMMVGMLVYILVLTVLSITVSAIVEDGDIIDAVGLIEFEDEQIGQDVTLLKPKTAGSSGVGKKGKQNVGKKGKSGKTKKTKNGKGGTFGYWLSGVCMICFAYPMVWMNERKLVKIYKVIAAGRENCVEANCEEPNEENNFKLVHAKGTTSTEKTLDDELFGLSKEGLVKLRRDVEVYQWVEEEESYQSDDETKTRKVYVQKWSGTKHNSDAFEVQQDGSNPASWPFEDKTVVNDNVRLAAYKVSASQVGQLNSYKHMPVDGDFDTIAGTIHGALAESGYGAPQMYNDYVYARLSHHDEGDLNTAELGDIRVKWQMVVCSDVSFISQQMKDKEGEFTFRNWNPDKEDVEWGESTDQDIEVSCPFYCLPCFITECFFKAAFQETIDYV
jgi:hypothetical protein